jgi:eukaryotic-like serine/threonine-protein kinase
MSSRDTLQRSPGRLLWTVLSAVQSWPYTFSMEAHISEQRMEGRSRTPQVAPGKQHSEAMPLGMHFCPHGGLLNTPGVSLASQTLLHRRLNIAAWVLGGGFTLFYIWHNIEPTAAAMFAQYPAMHAFRLALICLFIGLGSILSWVPHVCYKRLRLFEALLFGSAAVFFLTTHIIAANAIHTMQGVAGLAVFLPTIAIPWLILVQVYGMFIPNTWERSALVIVLFALGPGLVVSAIALFAPATYAALDKTMVISVILWMVVPAASAIYGSHRIELMNREIHEAEQLGSYSLRRKLGAGGMGEVYLAEHKLLKRPAAIKLIKSSQSTDPNIIARFESEVRTTALLTHPNTVEIYDFGVTEDGTFFYVMEYLPGMDLQDLVDWHGAVPASRAIYLTRQVCGALAEAHGRCVIHRDIKPGNIFVAERGGVYDVAKLLDFGLVRTLDQDAESVRLTQQGAMVGSPAYTSPENVTGEGEPDARGDIYSLGATLYFLVTGRPVFEGVQPIKVLFAHVNEKPIPPRELNSDIPADLEAVILRCLEKSPSRRFQTVSDVELALSACRDATAWTPQRAAEWWKSLTPGSERPKADSSGVDPQATLVTPVGAVTPAQMAANA